MDRYREVERKFDADPAMSLPDLTGEAGSVGEATQSLLDATYFDTADARLARHHITLRRRTGGDDAGWHLKLPAGQDERTEVRLPLGRATRTVPAALVREVRAIVRERPLVPVATARLPLNSPVPSAVSEAVAPLAAFWMRTELSACVLPFTVTVLAAYSAS